MIAHGNPHKRLKTHVGREPKAAAAQPASQQSSAHAKAVQVLTATDILQPDKGPLKRPAKRETKALQLPPAERYVSLKYQGHPQVSTYRSDIRCFKISCLGALPGIVTEAEHLCIMPQASTRCCVYHVGDCFTTIHSGHCSFVDKQALDCPQNKAHLGSNDSCLFALCGIIREHWYLLSDTCHEAAV